MSSKEEGERTQRNGSRSETPSDTDQTQPSATATDNQAEIPQASDDDQTNLSSPATDNRSDPPEDTDQTNQVNEQESAQQTRADESVEKDGASSSSAEDSDSDVTSTEDESDDSSSDDSSSDEASANILEQSLSDADFLKKLNSDDLEFLREVRNWCSTYHLTPSDSVTDVQDLLEGHVHLEGQGLSDEQVKTVEMEADQLHNLTLDEILKKINTFE